MIHYHHHDDDMSGVISELSWSDPMDGISGFRNSSRGDLSNDDHDDDDDDNNDNDSDGG